jgi:TRAP-type C4-dicarboxylate transport system substrate-binding protein
MHKPRWDALSAEQRAALERSAARQPASMLRAEVREFEGRMLAVHEQAGGRIVRPTPEQRDAFRAVIAPTWPSMVAEAGPEAPAFFERVETARAACAAKG